MVRRKYWRSGFLSKPASGETSLMRTSMTRLTPAAVSRSKNDCAVVFVKPMVKSFIMQLPVAG
jgi:hypothetical protein